MKSLFKKLCLCVVVAGVTAAAAQTIPSEVPVEIEQAVLAEDWKTVADYSPLESGDNTPPVLRFLQGHACLALNRNNEAVKLLRDTGKSDELKAWVDWTEQFACVHHDFPFARCLLGDALARQGRHEDAISAFTTGLRLSPGHPLLLNARAVCFAAMHEWNQALVDLDDAATGHPNLADIHANQGDLNVRRSLGAPGALSAFERALKLSPDFVLAKIGRASALYGLGKWPEAQRILEECKLDPDSGHLSVINAALVREALLRAEVATFDEKTAGVSITKAAREQQFQLQSANREILRNDLAQIAHKFAGDTLHDVAQPVKAVMDTFTGVKDLQSGKFANGVGKLAGVAGTIGKNELALSELHRKVSSQSAQDWSKGMSGMQALRSGSVPSGGVSTEDLRRGFLDKGDWRLLARFALQYPEKVDDRSDTAAMGARR